MGNKVVDFSSISKREMSCNPVNEYSSSQYLYDIARESLKENKSTASNDVIKFFENCTDKKNANKHFRRCLSLLEKVKEDSSLTKGLESTFVKGIIPCIENLNELKGSLDYYSLNESFKEEVLDTIKENKICDRILDNDKKLNKRFDFSKYVQEHKYSPLEETVSFFCSMIDTFDIPPYAKMNIVFEEMNYLLQKNYIDYERKDLVKNVTEYFLFRESNIDKKDYDGYKNVLMENMTISEEDLSSVDYFLNRDMNISEALTQTSDDVAKILNDFKAEEIKDEGKFKYMMNKIFSKDPEDIIDGTPSILHMIRSIIIFGTFIIPPLGIINFIMSKIISMHLDRKQIDKIISAFEKELESVELKLEDFDNDNYDELVQYQKSIEKALDKFREYKDDLYTDDNIKSILQAESCVDIIPLNEFKLFKFNNLIRATIEIDKFLTRKGNKLVQKISSVASKIFKPDKIKKWFKESYDKKEDFYEYITENNCVDICVTGYTVEKESAELHDECAKICSYINESILPYDSTMKSYYLVKGNTYEIRLMDRTSILLSEAEQAECDSVFMEEDLYYLGLYESIIESASKLESFNIQNLTKDFRENYTELSPEELAILSEASMYTNGLISMEDIKSVADDYCKNSSNYIMNSKFRSIMESYTETYYPSEIVSESVSIIRDILEANVKTKKPDKSGEKFAAKIDTLRLALQALKGKAKNLSAKEQEISKNLDSTVGHYLNATKQFITNDRREAIIKGSMIPSFSKAIKYAIVLAGTGIAAHSVIIPAILLFGGLAISKKNNKRERALMLDEIEIELKIVEKEISMAEGDNDVKKMRSLMVIQKNLQRERQRIRYNIKVGQDMPNSGGDM